MSAIKPVPLNPSLSLITPGWPIASVQQSNPTATVENAEVKTTPASAHQTTVRAKALAQSGHSSDGVDR
jgi:hypothetical protein